MTIPVRQLKNGFAMPLLGMGSWMLGGGAERDPASDGEKEAAALRSGLELGFRHIDTAEMYAGGFSEEIVGRAIRGRKRSDLFLTSKVWKTHLAYDEVLRACERSLRRLGTHIRWRRPSAPSTGSPTKSSSGTSASATSPLPGSNGRGPAPATRSRRIRFTTISRCAKRNFPA